MQTARLMYYCLLYFFTCSSLLQAEGFATGTIVKTSSGYTKIEQLKIEDKVISTNYNLAAKECLITNTTQHIVNCCIKIGINNEYIYAASNQKFYSYNQQKWICAHQLQPLDLLTDWQGQSVNIDTIETINKQCIIYQLSIETNHTFCVSSYNLIAHNSYTVVINLLSYVTPIITGIVQTGLAVGSTFIGAHFAQKIAKKHRHDSMRNEIINSSAVHSGFGGGGGWQDPDDNNQKKHPHGIYKESPAHRSKKCGRKSPSPKNGQNCLDHSLPGKGNSTQRVSIEGDNFIILKQTSHREFHGYCVTWDELHWSLQQVLRDHQLVTRTGKIIKEAACKVFK